MSVKSIITRGFGAGLGTIKDIITRGFSSGLPPVVTPIDWTALSICPEERELVYLESRESIYIEDRRNC
jgi:hypothetical protein